MAECSIVADRSFGPAVTCPSTFDFTLVFEQSILLIGPSTIFLLLVLLQVWRLYRASVKTIPNFSYWINVTIAIALFALQIASLILWTNHRIAQTAVPAAALSVTTAVAIIVLSATEHRKSVRPSTLLSIYLLLSIFLDGVQLRTLFIRHYPSSIAGVFAAAFAVKVLLLISESQSKRPYLRSPYHHYPPESTSGIFNRTLFWWLNGLFLGGFRKLLSLEDLFQPDEALKSAPLKVKIESIWGRYSSKDKPSLVYVLVVCLQWQILRIIFPRLCLIGFSYAQTFFIHRVIDYLQAPDTQDTENWEYGLIGAAALIYGGIAISTVHYRHELFRMITMFRGAVVSLIYSHTLSLQAGVYDESASVTLMSTDVDIIAQSLQQVNEAWARLIEIGIGIWLLERQLGAVCVAPIVVVLVCTSTQMYMASFMPTRQKTWIQAIQRRVSIISAALRSMKSVKMLGISEQIAFTLQGQRLRELKLSKKFRWLIVWVNVVASLPQLRAPLITFAAFIIRAKVNRSPQLSTAQAFTSLAIISLITNPALQLLASIPAITAASGCFSRIHGFLVSSSIVDIQDRTSLSSSKSSLPSDRDSLPHETGGTIETRRVKTKAMERAHKTILTLSHAIIRPVRDGVFYLQDVNLHVERETLTILTGPVGCGKTTLLKAILGEIPLERGAVKRQTSAIAYCSQNPWLQNTSILNIVCGPSALDLEWYREVLQSCALYHGISQMPLGDKSVVGNRALTLSGGQKQRLALARAAYSRAKLVVLDDVFSSLDTRTAHVVFENLLGKYGLFRKLGSAVILATHSAMPLPLADNIIVFDPEGHITGQGSFEDLKMTNIYIKQMLATSTKNDSNHIDTNKSDSILRKTVKKPSDDDIAEVARRTGDIAVYKYYLRAIGWQHTLLAMMIITIYSFSANFPQVWIKWFTEINGQDPGRFMGIYVLLAVTASASQGLMIWQIMIKIVVRSGAALHKTLVETVMRAPLRFFAEVDSGTVLNRFSQDMTLVDAVLPTMTFGTFMGITECLAQAALISLGSAYMAITIAPCLLVLYCVQKVYLRTSRQLRFLDLEARSPLYAHFVETLEGLSTIRSFGWQSASTEVFIGHLDASQKPYYLLYCIQRWLNVVLDLLVTVLAVIVITLATSLRSTTNPGNLGVSLTAILSFNQTLQNLVTSWTSMETSLGAIARTRMFEMKTPSENGAGEDFIPEPGWPAQGNIEIRSLTASYDGTTNALEGISMNIKSGQKIGICGRTGSGKSTLLSILLRLQDIKTGTILIDDIDIVTIPRNLLRSRLIAIPQDPFILPGSIRFNADPMGTATDEEIISALTKVHLSKLLESRSGGLDADLTEQTLSHGEQQLFALSRAILRRGKGGAGRILILDEATSSMDVETDRLIQEVIRTEFSGYTILCVAHRMETIRDSDKIALLDGGRLVRFGPPDELA
ncbi:hypothetical protein DTO164E3_7003 [Paecilomyces variotii]|nr:hypothetical protein DTO164E3_7003 [Paecilomyces variotii]KAJ9195684.1 hypothetical protein DTO032I3_6738 [Paecilomyces variotii]KAJ9281561.1 hypothetical protein DTO021D3_1784 [Paecilomyces variotii]KAJ9338500.1 hypothetical protein DTO027B6_8964 [Paecilomyces variotii]KAJ9351237.1 hypothetical protein DTO027B9_6470 [Paecilomyces variotii]